MVPTHKNPGFNFIGRLLGPRGNTLKELQRDTGCKMLIRGKGSVKFRNGESEWEMAKLPQHAHLSEPLHVSPCPSASFAKTHTHLSAADTTPPGS